MPKKFEDRMAVFWLDRNNDMRYGVVIKSNDNSVDVVRVLARGRDTVCYDEGGARYETDRDNVALRSCPPPFTLLCLDGYDGTCFAAADMSRIDTFSGDALGKLRIIDGGDLISERDFQAILDHPWRDEKEMGRKPESMTPNMDRLRMAMALSEGIAEREDDGFQFGG